MSDCICKLSKFPKLRSLYLMLSKNDELSLKNMTFSIPPLRELDLTNIKISFFNIQRIFQEVASTLVHLTIYGTKIDGSQKLELLFTALETCSLDLDPYVYGFRDAFPNRMDSNFYEELLGAISGSAKTLKEFKSSNKNLNQVHFLKNVQVLEFDKLEPVK
jgi:hypothetical protein